MGGRMPYMPWQNIKVGEMKPGSRAKMMRKGRPILLEHSKMAVIVWMRWKEVEVRHLCIINVVHDCDSLAQHHDVAI